ncbi:uncharacterized protein EI97DRAFT_420070 [Westerdykella ornata]|uniref:P-loop containing nucleoside triphosphate hydrolase protein n=1 Tax=Westerdykella ornata TaxID=318751 RepID=A0A6A6JI88_WESOR|nr:uncharacterized protein EI97DRAFT_420070 [Westerdykella ornata]KAF2275668.1 hypothetical protein EI97DRAFT_420070 [Westerdykella ornata]
MELPSNIQVPLVLAGENPLRVVPRISRCRPIWDPVQARFAPCFLPIVSAIPAVIGVLVLLFYSFRLVTPYLPGWTKPFIREPKQSTDDLPEAAPRRRWSTATSGLLIVSAVGLALQAAVVLHPYLQLDALFASVAWGIAVAIVVLKRPRTASISLLVIFASILLTQLIVVYHQRTLYTPGRNVLRALPTVTSLQGIVLVLNMPLRDPNLPHYDIAKPYSTPTSGLRSPEDNLTPWQYMTVSWMSPLIRKGVTEQLNDDDVWDLGYEFKHAQLHSAFRTLKGSVTRRLLWANGMDLVRTTTLSLVQLAATLLTPVLLQRLLASMNDNGLSPRSATIMYALISVTLRLISAQCNVFTLWYSRRVYERSRGEMITMLYEKTLKRKILGTREPDVEPEPVPNGEVGEQADGNAAGNENGNADANAHVSAQKKSFGAVGRFFKSARIIVGAAFAKRKKDAKREDAASTGKILNLMRNDVYEVAQRFWDFPDIITKPAGAIFATLLIWRMLGWACLLGVLALLASQTFNIVIARYNIYFEKKRRVATDEKLQRITQFIESIRHLRWYGWQDAWMKGILEWRQRELHLRVILICFMTTLAFILYLGSGLFPAVAFYAFTKIEGKPLRVEIIFPAMDLFSLLESHLRALPQLITVLLNAYVAMGRIEHFMQEPDKEEVDVVPEGSAELRLENASFAWPGLGKNVLHNITLSFPSGLTVIYGEVASGKTALLLALLGELDRTGGDFVRPEEVIGYCAQTPWLQSMSIRDNILFSYPYEEARYREVLEACALVPDMAELKHGDLSNIGENGIGLSGGQKARVALARTVYSKAKMLFLDDPLSALDHQTAEYIVKKLFAGPLLKDRTTVLVTHRTELCHGLAKLWVELDKGRAIIHEPTEAEDTPLKRTDTHASTNEEDQKKGEDEQAAAVPDKFIEDEHRAKGTVKLHIYWRYIKAGTLRWWAISVVVMALYRTFDVGQTWFIKAWGEGYDTGNKGGLFKWLPPPAENVIPWLQWFFLFVTAAAILFSLTNLIMFGVGYHAAKNIFREAIWRVAYANFRFYDVTPVGRLMNRLTSDMNTIDGELSYYFTVFGWLSIGWISCVVVILSSTPAFMAFGVVLSFGYWYYFKQYLPTSQSLRRLEMVSLSPLMSNFGALVGGLTTIRAFSAQPRFLAGVINVVDLFQKNDHFYWSLQAWLALRLSAMSASSTLIMALIAIYTGISPGLTAFVLITASRFVQYTESICRNYGRLEMDFTSVERVMELLDLETEPLGDVDPPAYWPTYTGDIVFNNVTIRYAPHLEPALSNITLRIPAGSHTAIIGRTGSGKSTLALSLLATVVPEPGGSITVDGIDLAAVKRATLRSRITFLAQDPVLFAGTIRSNLDPLDEYSDAACLAVLSKIHAESYNWTLSTAITPHGANLSQGQRQLIALARAMLRRSPILIMDEATASIDFETAARIQHVLREEMRQSTVVTIAHRLEAVKQAEWAVMLSKGRVERFGRAEEMVREGGEWAEMLA